MYRLEGIWKLMWVSSSEPSVVRDRVAVVGHRGPADHVVDEPVLEGLLRGEPPVAVGVLLDLLARLPGAVGLELVELRLRSPEQVGLDGDVGCRSADAGRGLVHHDPRVREGVALALGAGG